ncbi:ScbA/BarX family gamma-butyrolactone biosynthesis protein [Streptomyces sp. SL13]|uniref:ScbA/BarX family gamma-butyrolactone biosynthesis protein n=1 Tax=Streptantibioticus silvisoli TaxID=2705255 RepID=A0AA90KI99_9ACTN|nr:ScbA/BarX family gamma-butyrolactone biosynthesis protein [Streptantibioticus silvisoli]MDI5972780.1 ScbA/BarX family gamma-butyrolactone biosynthesis protein [Streptantibioticus silvisoli]
MQSSSVTTPPVPLPRLPVTHVPTPAPPGTPQPPRHDFPTLTTTVPRQYVHRAAVSEVFLTNWETDGTDGFIVGAQWPRGHALFSPRYGQQDPLLLAETIRQAGALLAHAKFDVPLGHHFLMWDLSYTAVPGTLGTAPLPTDLTLRVTCHDVTRRGTQLSSLRYRAEVWRGALRIAVGSAGYNCTSAAVYRRIRGERPTVCGTQPTVPLPPHAVGHTDRRDVVLTDPSDGPFGVDVAPLAAHAARTGIGRPRGTWRLRVDTTHPVYFDHPQDHVPGMLLVEAARQAAQVLLGPGPVHPVALHSTFERYAELTAPCWIEAETGEPDDTGQTPVTVTARQDGETLFSAMLTCRPLA